MSDRVHPNFWKERRQPLMMLAPMEDVTDTAFRELVLRISDPKNLQVVFTEFTSTDGLCHPVGRERVAERLVVSDAERQLLRETGVKLVAQIWGSNPEKYAEAVRYITQNYDFDGIDINMGCPVRNVVAQGSCSALIENEPLVKEIISATKTSTHLPVSVKTRIGLKKIDTHRWIGFLLQQSIDGLIIHGRIQKQMSEGEANWDEVAKAVRLRNQLAPHIPIIGNGDVMSLEHAFQHMENHGVDGVMFGRGIFNNPWLFNPGQTEISTEERIRTLLLHLQLYEKAWGNHKPFVILRRFFKIYISGFPGASALRAKLMTVNGFDEARGVVGEFCRGELMPGNHSVEK